jgi:hypothetical protein
MNPSARKPISPIWVMDNWATWLDTAPFSKNQKEFHEFAKTCICLRRNSFIHRMRIHHWK